MNTLITPELKDKILCQVITFDKPTINTEKASKEIGIDCSTYDRILQYFARAGFIRLGKPYGDCDFPIQVEVEAHDYWHRGGFTVHEEILKGNIEKLGLELELLSKELSPDLLDKAQKIVTLANTVLSALNYMK
jgi:hypothetical protein